MTLPGFLLGVLVAIALAASAHLITDGGPGRFLAYLVVGQLAFWGGHLLALSGRLAFGKVGVLWLGTAVLAEIVALALSALLSGPPRTPQEQSPP